MLHFAILCYTNQNIYHLQIKTIGFQAFFGGNRNHIFFVFKEKSQEAWYVGKKPILFC